MEKRVYLSLSEIKEIQLAMMTSFDAYCSAHKLTYFLCGGTLLGAVRHKGYIPWDDDIDLSMPRADYEKLIELQMKEPIKDTFFVDFRTKDNYSFPYGKLVDRNTILTEDGTENQNLGVFIDLFPLDGLPNNKLFQKWHVFKCRFTFFCLDLKLSKDKIDINNARSFFDAVIKKLCFFRSYKSMVMSIHKSAIKYDFYKSQQVCGLTHSILAKSIMESSDYLPPVKLEFEGKQFMAPANWDKFLTQLYGDYLTLPPENKRYGKHRIKAWKV